jgi:hypothetical protein
MGPLEVIENARVDFDGTGNILAIDGDAQLAGAIVFHGNNSVVHLTGSNQPIRLAVEVSPNCVFHNGANSYFNGAVRVIVSEHQMVYSGDEGTYNFGIWVRTADATSCTIVKLANTSIDRLESTSETALGSAKRLSSSRAHE